MAYRPLSDIPQQFFDSLGDPLAGGTLYAYLAGTSTPTNLFSDNAGTVAGTSVTLDARGEPTTFKLIWLDTTKIYKLVLKDSLGSTIWSVDNISGDDGSGSSASSVFDQQTITATASQTLFSLGFEYVTGTNAMAVYKNGARLITGTDFTETSSTSVTLTLAAQAGDEYTFIGGQDVSSSFSSSNVSFTQSGTGATIRSVQTKLREFVSVKDFGAAGDGVTDDTAAFQALTAYCNQSAFKDITIPPGLYIVNTTISFQHMWFFNIHATGSNIIPKTGASWAQKPIVEFCSCYMGNIDGLAIQTNMTNAAYWAAVTPKTNLPTCGLMLRRISGTPTISGLDIVVGNSNQQLNFYNTYLKGYFEKAALVNTCSETILFEGGVIGGLACSAVIDTADPSQVYQPSVVISNRDKKFRNVEFHMEAYAVPAVTAPCIGLYNAVLDFSLVNCYFALGGMQSISDVAAGILLGQTTGIGGFTNITIEDCYGENAGDKFAFMDIQSYDIHDIRICGWRHSQAAGTTDAIVRYRGSATSSDAGLHLERIRPPTNTTNLLKIDKSISPVTIKNTRGIITAASNEYVSNADIRMNADDVYNSAPSSTYTVAALLPGNYSLTMDKYPVSSGFSRQRPISARGTTTLLTTVSPRCLFYFDRENTNVFEIALSGGLTTVEGPASWRSYQDLGVAYDFVGDGEVFYLTFTASTTLKHNFTPNSSFYFLLKSGADTTYGAGRAVCFVRNANAAVEV